MVGILFLMRLIKLPFQFLLFYLLKFIIFLRYKIDVKGYKEIKGKMKKGVVFLPNHPAEMDPIILMSILWAKYQPRTLIVEHFFYITGLRFFIELLSKPLPLPTMDVGNEWKKQQVEKLKNKILETTVRGDNFLIYPSGKLKSTGDEKLGGASLTHQLLQDNPDLPIVLVRTTGLWGSTFSRAITGYSPDFGKNLKKGFFAILKNLIFFTPRRKVSVEFEVPTEDFPRKGEKLEINEWLENWYNKKGVEPLTLVSFSMWGKVLPKIEIQEQEREEEVPISDDMKAQILGQLSRLTKRTVTDSQTNLHLSNDLGLDSLDIAQVRVFLEERFDVTGLAPGQLETVRDIMQAAGGVRKEAVEPLAKEPTSRWPKEMLRPDPVYPDGKTIQEAFLQTCERMGMSLACADATSGVLSYKKMKRSVFVLAEEIKKMPGDKIGILLPSSVGAYVTILATLFAGKTPVMLNWTTGSRNLEHAAEVCDLKVVLSSYRFLSRLDHCELGKVDDLLLLLEQVRRKISFKSKLKGVFNQMRSAKAILKDRFQEDQTAAIIFTSGTETLPKGVPLTHKNILENHRAAFDCIELNAKDCLYGVLPPFHSFGFSVTGLFPLLLGMRACFAPDPTDSKGLANDIEHWEATIFCCAPSFLLALLRTASDSQLKSLRLVVSGAEKAPQELYDTIQAKGKLFIEGYGISECSPIVTLHREGEPSIGVGKPIPNVELIVIDPETETVLDKNQEGEVCIYGPNVFQGYLGEKRDPFIELDGKKWYRSGDRGVIDESGNLTITGRLKRFLKIGGEMISMGGLEEDLLQIANEKGWVKRKADGPLLAITGKGYESDKPAIVLFTTFDVDREEVNKALKEGGHGRLVKISEIHKLEEIPLTGTGKTHFRLLDEMA